MADVIVKSTGRKFYEVDGATAALLMELLPGAIEYAKKQPRDLSQLAGNVAVPRAAGEPCWELAAARMEPGRIIGLKMLLPSGEVLYVDGPSAGIRERCEKALAGRKFHLPSAALVEEYARRAGC